MIKIKIETICNDYWQFISNEKDKNQDFTDGLINVNHVTLSANHFHWIKSPKTTHRKFTRHVKFLKPTCSETLAQIEVSGENAKSMTITLNKTVDTDVPETQVTIKVPDELAAIFGPRVKIDLRQSVTVTKDKGERSSSREISKKILQRTTSAEIHYTEKELQGHFKCRIGIKGLIRPQDNPSVTQQEIVEMISVLQKENESYLPDISEAEFTVTGKIKCRWECEHSVYWK